VTDRVKNLDRASREKGKRARGQKRRGLQSPRSTANNPKTDIVVAGVGRVVVAIGRPAIPRIVVPRAAAFADLSRL